MASAVAARSVIRSATASARSATARLSSSIFRSPVETSSFSEASISPHRDPFGKVEGRNFSTRAKTSAKSSFSAKTRRFRFQRQIDLKRSTSATGIVERIEYDPNRNSRIALVRWEGGALHRKCNAAEEFAPPQKSLESTAAAAGAFAFASLPGLVDESNSAYSYGEKQALKSNYVMVGVPKKMAHSSKSCSGRIKTSAKDVLVSAFSTKAKGENACVSGSFPRIAVAGSRPAFFVLGEKEEVGGKNTFSLGEIQKWKKDSTRWMHRIKRKGAISWQSLMHQENLGTGDKVLKAKSGKYGDDRAPVTYILASHQLRKGSLVMNWSEPSTSSESQSSQYGNAY
ncbi:hypothetical protein C2S51_036391 [Perilla frutescens var. frutescens]|nr:hypothetical protein C2S51_036391 [Perilla frutescens var. frutescens]